MLCFWLSTSSYLRKSRQGKLIEHIRKSASALSVSVSIKMTDRDPLESTERLFALLCTVYIYMTQVYIVAIQGFHQTVDHRMIFSSDSHSRGNTVVNWAVHKLWNLTSLAIAEETESRSQTPWIIAPMLSFLLQ